MSDLEGESEDQLEEEEEEEDEDPLASLGDKVEEEEVTDQPEPNPLTLEILAECLSLLCKTGNGLAHAYTRVDLKERELTDINALRPFIHLRHVDVSLNYLQDVRPLANLTQLLWLCADDNRLTNAHIEELPFLQAASFAKNRIRDTEGIEHPLLEVLNLNQNQIRSVSGLDPLKLSCLHTLEMRGNLLDSTRGINLPHLRHLYLAANSISKLEGLETLVSLQTLHLRENHIESLQGFSDKMAALQYLNVRGNLIVDIKEMKHLHCLPKLHTLAIADNPCAEDESHRLETLILLPGLERLDKEKFGPEDRAEASEAQRIRQEQEMEQAAEEADLDGAEQG